MHSAIKIFTVAILLSFSLLQVAFAETELYSSDDALREGCIRLLTDPYDAEIEDKIWLQIKLIRRWDIIDEVLRKNPELTKDLMRASLRPLNAESDRIYWVHQEKYITSGKDIETRVDRFIPAVAFAAGTQYTMDIINRFEPVWIGPVPERRGRFQTAHKRMVEHFYMLREIKELSTSGKISDYTLLPWEYRPPYLDTDRTENSDRPDILLPGDKETEEQRKKREAWEAKEKARNDFRKNNPDKYYAQEFFKCVRLKKEKSVKLDLGKLFLQIAEYGGRASTLDKEKSKFLFSREHKYAVVNPKGQVIYLLVFPSGYDYLFSGFPLLQFQYDDNGEVRDVVLSYITPYDSPEILKTISQALYDEK